MFAAVGSEPSRNRFHAQTICVRFHHGASQSRRSFHKSLIVRRECIQIDNKTAKTHERCLGRKPRSRLGIEENTWIEYPVRVERMFSRTKNLTK